MPGAKPGARDLAPLINKFFLALQNVRFYPPAHALVQESIADLNSHLQTELASAGELSFGFMESKLMVNGQVVNADPSQTRNLARQFELLHIGNVTLKKGLPLAELQSFLECIATKPEKLNETGGVKQALADRALEHVAISDIHYGRIEKDAVKDKTKPSAEDSYVKELQKASRKIPVSTSFVQTDQRAAATPGETPPPGWPSADELKELYALRDRFQTELDRKVHDAVQHYEVENKRLAFEKDTMDSIMRNVGEGVVVIGNDGNVLMANPAAEKLLGRQKHSITGQALKNSLRSEHSLVLSRGSPESIKEIEIDGNDAETRRVLRSSNAIVEDLDGRTIGMVSVLSDITKAREVDQLKSDFVANVSHELRSPLAAIQKNLSLILDQTAGTINNDQKEFLSLAKDNVARLTRLINDLLDLSKVESGKMELKRTRTDLKALVRNAVTAFTGWFREKNITARIDLEGAPLELEIDGDKITQVMNNLLSNALKFTPPDGEIRIALNAAEGAIEVSVSDTGVGIAPGDIQRIFNKFEQVSANQPIGANGTGLGLPLAREIVEKHGGSMRAQSQAGKGSTFSFTLPL